MPSGITIAVQAAVSVVEHSNPFVEVREKWTLGDWEQRPDLEFIEGSTLSSAQDLGHITLRRRYGALRHPWETSTDIVGEATEPDHGPDNLIGWWVRLKFITPEGVVIGWLGKIQTETRTLEGVVKDQNNANAPSGVQVFTAYEPLHELRKIHVSKAYYWDHTRATPEVKLLRWIPPMNGRTDSKHLLGNRSDAEQQTVGSLDEKTSYVYGGENLWTHEDYVTYVLRQFANQTDGGLVGPEWVLAGQTDILKNMVSMQTWPVTTTIYDILSTLINPKWGVDYYIDYDEPHSRLEVHVFSLNSVDASFGDATIPKNPNVVDMDVEGAKNVDVVIERTDSKRYSEIRVLGERMVVVATIFGQNEVGADPKGNPGKKINPFFDSDGFTLVAKWSLFMQDIYDNGTGNVGPLPDPTDPGELHDAIRKSVHLQDVYQIFGAMKDWNKDHWMLSVEDDGTLRPFEKVEDVADNQDSERRTLGHMPLRANIDYSQSPPVDKNLTGVSGEFLPPLCWMLDEKTKKYISAADAGITVSPLAAEWGVRLRTTPSHIVGLDTFIPTPGTVGASKTEPLFDNTTFVVTFAFETDQRFTLAHKLSDDPDGSIIEIYVRGAVAWFLPANTVIGIDNTGKLILAAEHTIQNDNEQLEQAMAGAIARFSHERMRAKVKLKGFHPWGNMRGHILTAVVSGGDKFSVKAPVTSIRWTEQGDTIVNAGFAE